MLQFLVITILLGYFETRVDNDSATMIVGCCKRLLCTLVLGLTRTIYLLTFFTCCDAARRPHQKLEVSRVVYQPLCLVMGVRT